MDFGEVLDRSGVLTIWQVGQPVRYVHGAISSFVQRDTGFRRTRYSAVVEPRLARLKLSSAWRIFQTLSVATTSARCAGPLRAGCWRWPTMNRAARRWPINCFPRGRPASSTTPCSVIPESTTTWMPHAKLCL
ncbi:contractile injection system protein, VgrG/Pvc8 family [Burkholderia cepacia]|uniref:contractile injection system protein, VgrG/Pvc8 family n=1 Tax=Burkholderia cepacia TaxID=292 RepID=UPI001E4702C4|nr:contractile injection system protein, VgrG/Pvc8 family [Burkholderia cepacia]